MTAGYPMAQQRGSLARPSLHSGNLPLTDLRRQKTLATLRFSRQWQQPGASAARFSRRNERPFAHPTSERPSFVPACEPNAVKRGQRLSPATGTKARSTDAECRLDVIHKSLHPPTICTAAARR